jgi:hypothetical protein
MKFNSLRLPAWGELQQWRCAGHTRRILAELRCPLLARKVLSFKAVRFYATFALKLLRPRVTVTLWTWNRQKLLSNLGCDTSHPGYRGFTRPSEQTAGNS